MICWKCHREIDGKTVKQSNMTYLSDPPQYACTDCENNIYVYNGSYANDPKEPTSIFCPKCGKTPVATTTTTCGNCRGSKLEHKAKEWWALTTQKDCTFEEFKERLHDKDATVFYFVDMKSFTNWLLAEAITELTNVLKEKK